MRTGARLQGAAEVLADILERHRTAAIALADWGKAHRFAGSGDRNAIGTLVYDALRRKASLGAIIGSDRPQALALAAGPGAWSLSPAAIVASLDGTPHSLDCPESEKARLLAFDLSAVPADPAIAGDIPAWLVPSFIRAFGERAGLEGAGLARRAPIDLRVNRLKATRDKVLTALKSYDAKPTLLSPDGVRIGPIEGLERSPNVESEAAHGKGWFEVQDEGSQIAALLAGAGPRQQVLDICAGAGGKALAFAANMQNSGQVYAFDRDKRLLRPIFERLKRAGARSVQVLDGGDEATLTALGPRFDVVFVDAPCTGTGTWRRRPDSKWRLRPESLATRLEEQQAVLALARPLVKPGGRLVYCTCSVLPQENGDQIAAFLGLAPEFAVLPSREAWGHVFGLDARPPASADGSPAHLLLTPASHGTDGFFVCVLVRQP